MSEVEQEQEQQTEPEPEVEGVPAVPDVPTEEEEEGEHEHEQEQTDPEVPDEEAAARQVGMGEKEIEKMHKRVGQASATYAKRITEILGDEAQMLELCPRCVEGGFPGFIFPPTMAPISPEAKAAVLLSIGEQPADELEQDPYARGCEICKGKGYTKTGSALNAQKRIACLKCNGKGWVAVGDERRVAQQAVTAPDVTPENGTPVEQPPDADPWGRGPNDPDYGRLPQFVGAG